MKTKNQYLRESTSRDQDAKSGKGRSRLPWHLAWRLCWYRMVVNVLWWKQENMISAQAWEDYGKDAWEYEYNDFWSGETRPVVRRFQMLQRYALLLKNQIHF